MPKPRYKTTNWRKYNNSLINRGSLTFWIDEEAITEWKQPKQDRQLVRIGNKAVKSRYIATSCTHSVIMRIVRKIRYLCNGLSLRQRLYRKTMKQG
ncbi:hypothetical protein BST50_04385 [Vibrio vulnificus]|nr:hypothetical protein BST49_20800 [Vibrio vulnificus]PAO42420.1 hypothetical protein BST50_04385 [Vibrio vulnificus]PAO47209.1 hypothetical protein BST53_06815 [Vibrio vulnificus]PAO50869.1 hypothetical protein BST54_05255 [Vibrio vulnificus]PAO59137.1 hypothetical protein BST57_08110 [Vibrio vulnificus]